MMLMGAFFAILVADTSGSWIVGILGALAAGAVIALIHAIVSIHLRADQIVSGVAINFLALGVTGYALINVYGGSGTPSGIAEVPNVRLAFLEPVPFFGDAFGNLNLLIWISWAVLILSWVVMFRTPFGLRISATGEHPRAVDTVGLSVYRIRYTAVIISGMLAALGGAFLSIGFVHSFSENMTAGRGFIALAILIFGNWRPKGAFFGALLFGSMFALAPRLAVYSDSLAVLFNALPYVLTLIVVAGVIGRSIPPKAIGIPYLKR
jgi:simple sugar transport system permease protein